MARNDGQKGMGLIMLILIGVAPTAYALNRAIAEGHAAQFIASAHAASKIVDSPRRRIRHRSAIRAGGDGIHPRPSDLGSEPIRRSRR